MVLIALLRVTSGLRIAVCLSVDAVSVYWSWDGVWGRDRGIWPGVGASHFFWVIAAAWVLSWFFGSSAFAEWRPCSSGVEVENGSQRSKVAGLSFGTQCILLPDDHDCAGACSCFPITAAPSNSLDWTLLCSPQLLVIFVTFLYWRLWTITASINLVPADSITSCFPELFLEIIQLTIKQHRFKLWGFTSTCFFF